VFNIDIAKYGMDINKKCILGFPNMDYLRSDFPYFLFDLDPINGVFNKYENTYYSYGEFQSFCFQDKSCPPEYPFKKLGDFTNCWDCTGGVILSTYLLLSKE
jgi:hypothetical protein